MNNKNKRIIPIIIYMSIMGIGNYINSNILSKDRTDFEILVVSFIIQFIGALSIIYIVKKYYGWKNIGFRKINFKSIIWFIPYLILITLMMADFLKYVYISSVSFMHIMWVKIGINFIATLLVAFCEEVIFRGILLTKLKPKDSILKLMILSTFWFSIIHIVNIFMGMPLGTVFAQMIYSGLLGFSFVSLAIKLNNICPIIAFHGLWNFIGISSLSIGYKASNISSLIVILNIIVGTILWISIIKQEKNKTIHINETRKLV
ncbi:CPBP family intramembrane metalloprotease [Romboutsia sedimentorum]|uniref:CPBP family intramembrane glutamic endopeptidase n=1 Tax=Romboutsia sedimentorum TaxID=1368474 RepID=UPI0024DF019E|nr:CPBP family intramembrane glutamic endopeptidase [Romboutsia sedimentorum]MDK2586124.1 CPBP family intramembrane metalloprotease [Romboutsia sedimentorum]